MTQVLIDGRQIDIHERFGSLSREDILHLAGRHPDAAIYVESTPYRREKVLTEGQRVRLHRRYPPSIRTAPITPEEDRLAGAPRAEGDADER